MNLTGGAENDYFADGITEDVIAHLAKIHALSVISRTSVMVFKRRDRSLEEIGKTLGAKILLDGSVRRAGDRVRIVAKLIEVETDRHLWAETYDRQLTDIFSIQTDVALHIAGALEAGLSTDEQRDACRDRAAEAGRPRSFGLRVVLREDLERAHALCSTPPASTSSTQTSASPSTTRNSIFRVRRG